MDPLWDQDFRYRDKDAPLPKLKSWQYQRVRLAAPTFCDCVGRAAARCPDQLYFEVRQQKRASVAARRKSRSAD